MIIGFSFYFLLSLVLSGVFAYSVYKYGSKFGFTDIPNKRSSHEIPIPRGGGIGIPIAVLFIVLFFVRPLLLFILSPFFLSLFIFLDDRKGLPVSIRFFAGVFASLVFILFFKMEFLIETNSLHGFLITIVGVFLLSGYIVASANFFNFMDGINGMAGLFSIVAFGSLGLYSYLFLNSVHLSIISISIVGGAAGFLLFNFPKPKVFMGDTGSIFIGFLFASVVVMIAEDVRDILFLSFFQGLFLIDCISTIFIRIYKKENIIKPHLLHFYQRLVHGRGLSHVKVTLIYSGTQIIINAAVLTLFEKNIFFLIMLWFILFVVYWILRIKLEPDKK